MEENRNHVIMNFNLNLNSYKVARRRHNYFAFISLSRLVFYVNYLKDKNKISLVQDVVLGNDKKKSVIQEKVRKFKDRHRRMYKYEVDIKELLYIILYLDDCDINMLWEKFAQITSDKVYFYDNDFFSRDVNKDFVFRGKEPNILRYDPVTAELLNEKINMIKDEELKNKVINRFDPKLRRVHSKIRKRVC